MDKNQQPSYKINLQTGTVSEIQMKKGKWRLWQG
jgi:hypothetical protein